MLRETFYIFNQNVIRIIVMSLVLVVPISYFFQFFIIYFQESAHIELPGLFTLCVIILNFTVLFPPFYQIAKSYIRDEEISMKEVLRSFSDHFFLILLGTIVLFVVMLAGIPLLLVPTVLAMAFLLVLPMIVSEDFSLKEMVQRAWLLIKRENISIFGDILFIVSLQVLLWWGLTSLVASMQNNLLVYITLKVMLYTLLFPVLYIFLTLKYYDEDTFNRKEGEHGGRQYI
jgi:hypothetical protein